jgi:WD40 repeat protein
VTDLAPLIEMPLKELDCDFKYERDAEILRSIKTLETINGKPAKEFWKEYEAKNAFVLLARAGGQEKAFATLQDAVAAAKSGDTIEIRGDGPFATGPINLEKKALAIQAGAGFKPHLKYQPIDPESKSPLLHTLAPLVLEGLTLERAGNPEVKGWEETSIVHTWGAPFLATHCRLVGIKIGSALRLGESPSASVQYSEVLSSNSHLYTGISFLPASSSRLSLENNLIFAKFHGIRFDQWSPEVEKAKIIARHNTVLQDGPLTFDYEPSLKPLASGAEAKEPGLALEITGNILWGSFSFHPQDKSVSLEKAIALLPKLVSFQDQHNLYALFGEEGKPMLGANRVGAPKQITSLHSLAEWNKFWKIAKPASQRGGPVYQGGDVFAKTPDQLTPADFRLAKGSPGKGACPGGEDIGADVDKVGPGKPYEEWKKTKEYAEWRTKTDALMAEARVGPLDLLSRDDVPAHELRAVGDGDASKAPAELVAVLGDSRLAHWHMVMDLAFSPDGKSIASVGVDAVLRVWDAAAGEQKFACKLGSGEWAVAWSRNGKWLASGSGGTVHLWDAHTGKERVELEKRHQRGIWQLAFSPDDKWLASASDDGTVCLWEAETGKHTRTFDGHGKPVRCVAFSPDSKRVASGGEDNRVFVWKVADRAVVHTLNTHTKVVWSVAFRHDGKQIASGSDDATARVWNADTGEEVCVLEGHKVWVRGVAFQPETGRLAVREEDGVALWDVENRKKQHLGPYFQQSDASSRIAFSPDGKRLAAHSFEGIRVWDVASAKALGSPAVRETLRVSFRPDGKRLATGYYPYAPLQVFDLPTLRSVNVPQPVSYCPVYGYDGKSLALAQHTWDDRNHHDVCLCDADGVRTSHRLEGHTDGTYCLAFSRDGKLFASGSYDKTAILWDVATGKKQHILTGHRHHVHGVAFSPDGRRLVTGGGGAFWWYTSGHPGSTEGEVKVWDTGTGKEALKLDGHAAPGDVWSVAWSGDGKLIASASADRTVKLWDADTGKVARTFGEHKAGVRCVLFRHDSRTMLSVDTTGVLLEWDGASGKVLRRWQLPGMITHLDLAADGRHLATANFNGTAYVLSLEPAAEADKRPRPFAVLGRDGKDVRRCLSLKDAVGLAESGDTIEIRGDGPFATGPIDLGKKALAIRAGAGFRPHLKYQPIDPKSNESLLTTEAPLVLEGLTLERGANPNAEDVTKYVYVLQTKQAPLHLAHCRLIGTKTLSAVELYETPSAIVRNSEILGTQIGIGVHPGSSSLLSLENNLLAVRAHGIWASQFSLDLTKTVMIVRDNTVRAGLPLNFAVSCSLQDVQGKHPKAPGLRLEAVANVLDGWHAFFFTPEHESLTLEKAVPLLPSLLAFRDEHNLYALSEKHFLQANREGAPKSVSMFKTLAEWHQFWGIAKSTSQVGTPVYQGGDIYDRALKDPAQLTPADFRLAKGSPGKGKCPGGKDLGADVDKVGPGPAYDRWRQTAEYREWHKRTAELLTGK